MQLKSLRNILQVNGTLCALEVGSNYARIGLTALGIFLGAGSLLANLAFIRAVDSDLQYNMERIGGLNIITAQAAAKKNNAPRRHPPGLTAQEARQLASDIPSIQQAILYKDLRWNQVTNGAREFRGKIAAVDREYFHAYNYTVSDGRFFTFREESMGQQVCLLGKNVAVVLFGSGKAALGKTVTILNMPLTVVGVIDAFSSLYTRASECIIPFSLYTEQIGGHTARLDEVAFSIVQSGLAPRAGLELHAALLSLRRGDNEFEIVANSERIEELHTTANSMKVIFWCIAAISLVVGGISIMSIMFATVGDRTREIGIRMALGANRNDILTLFLLEAILVSIAGAIPGLLLGAGITCIPDGMLPFNPALGVTDYVIALLFTIVAGIASGLMPALKAAKLQPVEALRY